MVTKIREITPQLNAYALNLTRNKTDASDLYQNTLLKIIRNKESYVEDINFKGWALTIMRNIYINQYRKARRRKTLQFSSYNQLFVEAISPKVVNEGETNLCYLELVEMVQQLPNTIQLPFWMVYKGYKYEEIADALKEPLGTIKSRIFMARKKLQQMILATHAIGVNKSQSYMLNY